MGMGSPKTQIFISEKKHSKIVKAQKKSLFKICLEYIYQETYFLKIFRFHIERWTY
jgi:hypothetical protein